MGTVYLACKTMHNYFRKSQYGKKEQKVLQTQIKVSWKKYHYELQCGWLNSAVQN